MPSSLDNVGWKRRTNTGRGAFKDVNFNFSQASCTVTEPPSHEQPRNVMSNLGMSCPIQKLASLVTVHNFPRLVVLSPSC